jgi:histidinol-phosphate aminotransferase
VGYALAAEAVAGALRKTAVPFGVSAVAEEAAIASLDAGTEMQSRVDAIVAQRQRVLAALAEQGWVVPPSEANFVWLRLGERTDAFAAACAEGGVVVRPFAGEGVRVTVGEPAADEAFLAVAARWATTG